MATPPKKSALEYILNKDGEQSQASDDNKSRRRPRSSGSTASSTSPPIGTARGGIRQPRTNDRERSTNPTSRSGQTEGTPAGTSDSHARMGERSFTCSTCGKQFNERGKKQFH